jgi:DNA-binding NtrC family response regulator
MGKKILFVDDDKEWRFMVATWLGNAGYEVLTVADATAAMAVGEEAELGLIILDLDLAGESGVVLMQFMKQNHPDTPVILFTGLSHDDDTILAMLHEGAHQYVRKGAQADLVKAVQMAFGKK